MRKKCIVVIPVYQQELSSFSRASFQQVLTVLGLHDIALVTFKELDISMYKEVAKKHNKAIYVEFFEKKFFESVAGYNKLCLSTQFYERFANYSYMLIYQLDAWVFSDELDIWCNKGYDYIGSPLFLKNSPPYIFDGVGNGGFSLRRISHCLEVLNSNKRLPYLKFSYLFRVYYVRESNTSRPFVISMLICFCKAFIRSLGYRNTLHVFLKDNIYNEDAIFSVWAKNSYLVQNVCLPEVNEAAKFAFEQHPQYLFMITKRLPFGCHAFQKWEYESFWKKYIRCNI